ARRPEVAARLAAQYDAVYTCEYQHTAPAQVRLLHALAGDGRTLVALGAPDQSIYAFRGADVNGILEFPHAFPRADGRSAPVEVLRTSRRSGAALLAAIRLVTRRMPLPRLPAEKVRAHRELTPVREGGRVELYTYPTSGTELDNTADILRRAHLEDGVPWAEMAVLVRAGARTIPAVRRALTSAGVPVDVDGNDVPLRHEPAVAPLLTALRAVATAEAEPREREGAGAGTDPVEADPAEVVHAGTDPAEAAPAGAHPAEADPARTDPAEADPAGTDPAEADTAGTDPADADTARTHPTEADTARTHPTEADSAGTDLTGTGPAAGAAGEPGADAAVTADGAPVEGQASPPADAPVTATAGQAEDTCWLDTETALTLLTSPLAGMDAADLRRLGRALREEERAAGNPLPPS